MKRRAASAVTVLLLVAAIGLRLYGAWCADATPDPEHGLASLLAQQAVTRGELPLVRGGTPPMGTVEVAVGALWCRVLGYSGFAVNLGAVCFAALALLVIGLWGRSAAGPYGGPAALLFCAVGPFAAFEYMSVARGGYAAVLGCGTATVWLAAGLADALQRGRRPSRWVFVLAGLLAGIGWWTGRLMFPYLLAAACVWLVALGRRCCERRVAYGVLGFLAGSLPWWVWNGRHGWAGAGVLWPAGAAGSPAGLGAYLRGIPAFLPAWRSPAVRTGTLCLYAAMAAAALFHAARAWRQAPPAMPGRGHGVPAALQSFRHGRRLYLLAALALAGAGLVHAALLPGSGTEMRPALLPLLPVTAVLLATATVRLRRHLAWGLAWAPLLFLVSVHPTLLPVLRQRRDVDRVFRERAQTLAATLEADGIKVVYVERNDPQQGYGLNAIAGGRVAFVDPRSDAFCLYAAHAETAGRIAVLNDSGDVEKFLSSTAGSANRRAVAGFAVHDGFKPPSAVTEVAPARWHAVHAGDGGAVMRTVTDGRLATAWRGDGSTARSLTIAFAEALDVSGFRLRCEPGAYPVHWAVKVTGDDGAWHTVGEGGGDAGFFWSGPRPYIGGAYYRMEGRFPVQNTASLRLVLTPPPGGLVVNELQCLAPCEAAPDARTVFPLLVQMLRQRGISQLYSDRWVAGRLRALRGYEVATVDAGRRGDGTPPGLSPMIVLQPWTGLLSRLEDARLCREVLGRYELPIRETRVGPWVLFDTIPGAWREPFGQIDGLRWAGYACLQSD